MGTSASKVTAASAKKGLVSFYTLSAPRGDGKIQTMEEFRGKVVYATNVASKWGLTNGEYAQMEKLYQKHDKKLVIFGFPSREYGWQEYETDEEIAEFAATKNFQGILMKLGKIKGDTAPEVWKFFKNETGAGDPMWNFKGKFLVSKSGEVSVPTDLEADIERLVNEGETTEVVVNNDDKKKEEL